MTGKTKREQQLLDFAAAEGAYRERLSTLGNLTKVMDATCVQANVLRFIFEEGGLDRPVELVLPRIAGSPWIQSCENTVRKAIVFWESGAIIEIERGRRDGDKQAPNAARLLWSSVLRRLLGEGYSVSPGSADSAGRSADPSGHSDRRFSASSPASNFQPPASNFQPPASNFQPPASNFQPPASNFQPPASNSCRLAVPFSRSPIRVLACARGLLSLSSVCTVVDNVSTDRRAEFAEIWDLAEEARRPIYPVHWPKDPQVKETFVQGAVLAAMLFTRRWLMNATRAVQAKRDTTPWRYWIGCLRNGLTETEGLQSLGTREEARSYFATLMNAAAPIALEVIAEYGAADRKSVPTTPDTKAERAQPGLAKEFRAKLAQRRAAP